MKKTVKYNPINNKKQQVKIMCSVSDKKVGHTALFIA